MRVALRNKTKLIKAFDESYYNLLMESLKQHFKNSEEIQTYSIEGEKYQIIDVPNVQPNTKVSRLFMLWIRLEALYEVSLRL